MARSPFYLLTLFAPAAWAHHPGGIPAGTYPWNFEPWVVALLALSLALYVHGVRRLWRKAGRGRGISTREAASFGAGWTVLALALLSPIDTFGGELFSIHMVQHELLMVVAAPLFVLARPLEAWAWALPPAWSAGIAAFARRRPVEATWKSLTEPTGAWLFHAAAIWLWHVPPIFEAAVRDENVHALQHATFLVSALCFWWSVLQPRGKPGMAALASVFTTMLHTGALGALLTFGPHPWYAFYSLEDQQVGGLVMWVPGGLAYLAAGMWLIAAHLLGSPDNGALRTPPTRMTHAKVHQGP